MPIMNTRSILVATASVAVFATLDSMASASCVPMTPAQQRAQAAVIFDGVALEGPTPTGIQRFRVTRYGKGSGPQTVRVNTGYKKGPNGTTITSVSVVVQRGEKWRIYGHGSARKVVSTNVCLGSRKL
jgi:hypothetical protein